MAAEVSKRAVRAEDWPPGTVVELRIGDPVRGKVTFLDGEWIHWDQEGGRWVHASKASVLRRLT